MEGKGLETLIEGILFAAGEPVSTERLSSALGQSHDDIEQALEHLSHYYQSEQRGIRLLRLGTKAQLCSASEYASQIRTVLGTSKPRDLSRAALEVCSIVAYFQPVTRAFVEQIRGVDSAYTIGLLLERGLIAEAGRLSVPGRPLLYRTTDTFLRVFGLEKLEELPALKKGLWAKEEGKVPPMPTDGQDGEKEENSGR